MRLATRILAWVALGMVVTLAVAFPLIAKLAQPAIHESHVDTLAGMGTLLSRLVAHDSSVLDRPDELERMIGMPTAVLDRTDVPGAVERQLRASPVGADDQGMFRIYFAIDGDPRIVAVGPLPEANFNLGLQIAAALAITLIVSLLITFALVRPLLLRLQALRRAAERLSEGDFAAHADDDSQDSLGAVARAFNDMRERLQAMIKGQRDLLQAVSHEFRTPASRIRFELELLRGKTDAGERERKIAAIEQGLDDLELLVSELTDYVRFETGAPTLTRQPVMVAGEAERAIERHRHLRGDLQLGHDIDDELEISASPRYFRRVIDNLVSNAVRHASERVHITAVRDGDVIRLRVEDDGPGIEPAERARVFEPFTRLDDSRSREFGGTGLGLAMVAQIMDWHGGDVRIEDARLGGAAFECTWPVEGDVTSFDTHRFEH